VERGLTVLEPAPITDNTRQDTAPMGMTLAQQLLERGKTEGKADALLQLLRQRFGDIPQKYTQTTRKASAK